MGEKLNRRMMIAAGVLVGVAGFAQFAGGVSSLFGAPNLPDCDGTDARSLVTKIIADNYEVKLEGIDEVAEVSFDDEGQIRACSAIIRAGEEGSFRISYDLSWHDRDERMLYAQVQIGEQVAP